MNRHRQRTARKGRKGNPAILRVGCPLCGAQAQEPCRDHKGVALDWSHAGRRDAFRKAKRGIKTRVPSPVTVRYADGSTEVLQPNSVTKLRSRQVKTRLDRATD